LVTGDVIDFIQILGNVLDLGVPSDNTVSLAKLTATGTKDATTFLRGDNTFAVAGGTNTPAFFANANGQTITISNASTTKVSYNTEVVDTDNNYSSGRFTPTTAGKYFCFASLAYDSDQDFDDIRIEIRKNSTTIAEQLTRNMYYSGLYTSAIADLNGSSDYIEIYTTQWSGANADLLTNVDGARCVFGAYKLLT
jgi:hypothetical protein